MKASEIKPGMVVNIKRNNVNDFCLITAVKGRMEVEYTHLDYQDSYNGLLIGSIKGNTEIQVINGKKRQYIIDKIKEDVFRSLHDTENIIDTIRLIEAMQKKK
jgi:hypothetical protein